MEEIINTPSSKKEMVQYPIEKISSIIVGTLHISVADHTTVFHLLTDSRKIVTPEFSLFFAIKGDRRDGHEFIDSLIRTGVHNFVISNQKYIANKKANFIVVNDTLDAMQRLASFHRAQFNIPVIGITGSNGKTIVKEWVYQLLREDHHIVRSPKSYNSQIGVPLSVWQMKEDNDLAIFEAGISLPGEMEKLEEMIHPSIGIFTNIGQAHDENFSSLKDKIIDKLKLFKNTKTLIYNRDYTEIKEQISAADFLPADLLQFTWSRKSKADLQIGRISKDINETQIQGIYKNNFISIQIPFIDDASIENAVHCWALMLLMNSDNEVISERMKMLSPVAMRLEMKEGINNCSIINDSYNSDLGSLAIALDFLNQQKQHNKKTVILSDILQSGKNEKNLYTEVADLLSKKNITYLVGIGSAISNQAELFKMQKSFYSSTEEFIKELDRHSFHNETILLKGARPFGFERITKLLQQKAHETVLEINLNAMVHNLNYYRSRLRSETKIMAMVKAFSYGSGSFEIANTLVFHRVDYLAVAYADEGVELRKAGISVPIMVMNPEEQSFDSMITYYLEPEIYSFRILSHFSETLKRRTDELNNKTFPIHIKLDTGMRRLGFELADINELVVRIKNNKFLKIDSVFSHLAGSDEAVHDGFTKKQIEIFTKASHEIQSHFNYQIPRHILNSAGIMRFPEAQFEMVRVGIGLHGIAATTAEQKQLHTVSTLKTTISQIKSVKAGESIGYNRKGIAIQDMQIATVGIGYADGLSRRLGNGGGKMLVNGKFALIIGNVCMDMTMIDITEIPSREGDEVIIFGTEYTISQIAIDMGTIPYEVLTNISQRVKRIYFHE
ncbi:MAG: bifunctional UDP-N-acetylmuramoyl-tripeptide:D-alanyl-D-alanine ligase/alanine racemase [Bacteroidia bacterium]